MRATPKTLIVLAGVLLFAVGCIDESLVSQSHGSNRAELCEAAADLQSYYSPSVGTLNLHYGVIPCEAPKIIGAPAEHAYVVLNDVGRYISRINADGKTAWTYATDVYTYISDLRITNGDLQFIEVQDIVKIDAVTGEEKSRHHIGYAICYDGQVQCLDDGVLVLETQEKIPAQYPRSAVIFNGVVYVADTFGHQVIAYDAISKTTLWTVDSYFPNYIQVENGRLVVTEEHANRIVSIDLTTHTRTIVAACKLDIFLDPESSIAEIQDLERSGALTHSNGRSACNGDLYSPNHAAIQEDGSILISDTDNHRILHLDASGKMLREIRNFNNPIRTFLVP